MRVIAICTFFLVIYQSFAQDQLDLVIPEGHTRPVQQVAISEDTLFVASIDFEPEIIVWSYTDQMQLFNLKGHSDKINHIHFSGEYLISASEDSTVIIWDVKKNKEIQRLTLSDGVFQTYHDGKNLLTLTNNGSLQIWKADTLELLNSLDIASPVTAAVLDSDAKIWIATKEKIIRISKENFQKELEADLPAGNEILTLEALEERILAGTNRGYLVSFSIDFDVISNEQVMQYRVYDIEAGNDSSAIWVAGRDAKPIKKFNIEYLSELSFSLDSVARQTDLTLGVRSIVYAHQNILYGIPSGLLIEQSEKLQNRYFKGLAAPLTNLDIKGNMLFLSNQNHPVRILDLRGIKSDQSIGESQTTSFDVDPLQRKIAMVGGNNMEVCSIDEKKKLKSISIQNTYTSTPVIFDPTGNFIVRKNSSKYIDVLPVNGGKSDRIKVKNGFDFTFSEDGKHFFIKSGDEMLMYDFPGFRKQNSIEINDLRDFDLLGNQLVELLT